ncbi:MAG: CCA tRNA nucleotidyltransferase [Nitrososphaeria archaeon]|nr:CCA tRNA nucleotidyltransferase [Nitrososphaeria archaeon]NIN53102.1 CCA tRNA nucleotidyltransferase [Nitrososphaeria archaeon]NIQ33868.1 CCA tRNA nucleotidyltransferase [Nitrososphaeria archaeon]
MSLNQLLQEIMEEITPKPEERVKLERLYQAYMDRARRAAEELTSDFKIFLGGSLAKDTALSEDTDIDLFVLLSPDLSKKEFRRLGLEIGERTFLGHKPIERYADHPYLEATVDGVKISVVPTYRVEPMIWKSPVDRTFYHVQYIKERLREEQKREVRLLKKFMKGVGTYGAEVRVKGFSGYLCELLILHHRTFLNLLQAVQCWSPPVIIDIEDQYRGDVETIQEIFKGQPLVVIDPVDKGRNVAASPSAKSLASFISASWWFLRRPSRIFFYPPPTQVDVDEELSKAGDLILLTFRHGWMVEDTLYPQLERMTKKIGVKLKENGFRLLRAGIYSDFMSASYIIFELESKTLPKRFLHMGPPPFKAEEAFVKKNLNRGFSVWISEEGRWVSSRDREIVDARKLVEEIVKGVMIPKGIRNQVRETVRILADEQIKKDLGVNPRLREYLEDFFLTKEFWVLVNH